MASTRFACLFNCGITEYNFFGHITREAGAQNDWFKIRMNDGSSIPIISQQPLRFFKHLLGFTSLSAWQIAKAPLSYMVRSCPGVSCGSLEEISAVMVRVMC